MRDAAFFWKGCLRRHFMSSCPMIKRVKSRNMWVTQWSRVRIPAFPSQVFALQKPLREGTRFDSLDSHPSHMRRLFAVLCAYWWEKLYCFYRIIWKEKVFRLVQVFLRCIFYGSILLLFSGVFLLCGLGCRRLRIFPVLSGSFFSSLPSLMI